jgi:pimeloyl-ACP methyl ester carboxylesterase
MTRLISPVAFCVVLLAGRAGGQAATCTGLNVIDPGPSATLVELEVGRDDASRWRLLHARLNRAGANDADTLSFSDGTLAITIARLASVYRGDVVSGGRVIRGTWTTRTSAVPLTLRCSPLPPARPDSSPHYTQFVTVDRNVRLEVLDWGGSGRPVVLLHGMNATAHDFDAFAPKLTPKYHVYAITRRGSGRSTAPDTGYGSDRLGDDVLAVMDSLRLRDVVLVGHSFGGAQLSSVGSRFPSRVAGLVYLDAALAYAFVDSAREDPFEGNSGGWLCPCSLTEKLNMGMRAYRRIPVPVLAIYAVNANWERDDGTGWTNAAQAREFERGVPGARVVRLTNADHYVFRSNEADVLREIEAFIGSLPRSVK